MKRSQAVSLVVMVGAGLAAYGLARRDPSQQEEDVLVYVSADACAAARRRTDADCRESFEDARAADARIAPRYPNAADCETRHGAGGCRPGGPLPAGTGRYTVPLMAAALVGRAPDQGIPPQPLYRDAGGESAGSGQGAYCTAAGGSVVPARGDGTARVATDLARRPPTDPEVVARGGFGFACREIATGSTMGLGSGGGG